MYPGASCEQGYRLVPDFFSDGYVELALGKLYHGVEGLRAQRLDIQRLLQATVLEFKFAYPFFGVLGHVFSLACPKDSDSSRR